MPKVYIPPLLQKITDGQDMIESLGKTVADVIDDLEIQFPGIKKQLCEGNELKPGLNISVDGKISSRGLLQKLDENCEVHFLPSVGGG